MNIVNSVPLIPQMYADPVPYLSEDLPFDLFKSLYVSSNGPNFIFSPYSAICALMMLLVGSSGHTQLQLARALFGTNFNDTLLNRHVTQFDRLNRRFIFETWDKVQIGNFIYSQQEFKPNYTQTIAKLLKANATLVDFDVANQNSTIERINWDMSRVTNGAVPNFLSNIEDNANLLLLNTIHFHAIWHIKFNENLTQLGQFRISPNKLVQATMMKQQEEYYGYQHYRNPDSGLEAIKMPYDGSGQVSMVIILPPDNVRSYIRDQFNAVAFDAIFDNFREHTLSPLIIPRFKLSLKHSLKSTLRQLGIADAFESDSADFSRMTQRVGLPVVSEIMQNAAIECNETGDRASWEDFSFEAPSGQPSYAQFIANRPFLFVVVSVLTSGQSEYNQPNSVKQPKKSVKQFLFAGVVEDPTV